MYLGGDAYSAPMVYVRDSNSDWVLYDIVRDYQGSITHLVDDSDGTVVAEYSYDPWGRLRDPQTLAIYTPGSSTMPELLLGRGYTAHEHLTWFGLINMNARLYDPALGRFLSPDPYVQAPDFSQNFNRYSYCLNNPLKYTDEEGEFIFSSILGPLGAIIDAACWGAVINAGFYSASVALSEGGFDNFSWKDFGLASLSGAINGALSAISPANFLSGSKYLSLTLAPQISIGSDGVGFGINLTAGINLGNFTFGANAGASYFFNSMGTGNSGFEGRLGYGIDYKANLWGTTRVGIGSTYFFSGETSQLTGQFYIGGKNWKATYENDTWVPVPGLWQGHGPSHDKYRTAAFRFDILGGKYKGANVGLNIFTGKSTGKIGDTFKEEEGAYRAGILYLGYGRVRFGLNNEKLIRGPIQNGFHDLFSYPHFNVLSGPHHLYYGCYSSNPYSLW